MKDLIFQNEALPLEKVYKLLMDYSNTFYPPPIQDDRYKGVCT